MQQSVNGTDPTVTVESEKQTITIGSSSSSAVVGKPTITFENEQKILKEIESLCTRWRRLSRFYVVCIAVFGISAIITSVLVSIYTGNEDMIAVANIKVMACVSTISLGILTAFNLVANANNARNAWRSLNAALMFYDAGSISLQQLIEQYQKGENQIGNVSFNYGSNADKSGTYAHDIASPNERKQKQADLDSRRQKAKSVTADERAGNRKVL